MELKPGERFGRLTVVRDEGSSHVVCKCDCGQDKITTRKYLRVGEVRSCGCLHHDKLMEMSVKHGDSGSRLYRIWKSMRTRATNRNHVQAKDYVLRGISVCPEWSDYSAFKAWAMSNGYSDNLTIDRIDNDGPYSPQNCRWITQKEQCRNKRNTHVMTYKGITYHTIRDMCFALGLNYRRTQKRMKQGWPLEEAIELKSCASGPRKAGQMRSERQKENQ